MRKLASVVFWALLYAAVMATASEAQSACSNRNLAPGEGKFTGQIASVPNGSSMQVRYGLDTVTVRYSGSVTVCENGQPGSVSALARGEEVSVFGPRRGTEIEATRIFVAVRPGATGVVPPPNMQPAPVTRANPGTMPNEQPPAPVTRVNPGAAAGAQQAPMNRPGAAPAMNAQQVPIPAMRYGAVAGAVILTGGTHAQAMQRLHVVRTYSLTSLRSSPQVTLGESKVNFQPMLSDPQAPFNVAERLRALPQHVEVREDTSEISEVDQGLVIHHVLTYRILPGKCADASAAAQLAQAGVQCVTKATQTERVAEFSRPGNARYVADAGKRQAAIAAYQKNVALEEADAKKGIAQLRSALSDPTQRAAIVAQVGEAEAARMQSLNDDDLTEELINSGVQQIEDTMFVPKAASNNFAHPQVKLAADASAGEINATQQLLHSGVSANGGPAAYPKLLMVAPARSLNLSGAGGNSSATVDLGTYIFLTGFTIGHDYEWSWGEQVTIDWCIVGCASTYGLGLFAGFNYGFGLRFPIQATFNYQTEVRGQNATAAVTANFVPIEGTAKDFASTGLDPTQVFGGKEIVAQVGANAGFNLSLPGINVNPDWQIGVDFTNYLPAPYTGGRFTPPAPGSSGINSPFVLNQIDLLGGLLNYGVAGGQVFPAVNVNLHSDELQFTMNDEDVERQAELTKSPETLPVTVRTGGGEDSSHFSVGNPVYNLGFTVTPGLNPQVFVDIAVWSHQWNWQIWFPQLAISLPPGGVNFSCHNGTTCVVDFKTAYNPSTGRAGSTSGGQTSSSNENDVADRTLTQGGCERVNGKEGYYLCPVKGMLGLCNTMLNNGFVTTCGALVPNVVDQILRNGHCTGSGGNYSCPNKGMMGLCETYVKNQEILSCKQTP